MPTTIETYLFFDGNCAEAMTFYQQALGGSLFMMKVGEAPDKTGMPPGSDDKIIHSKLDTGGAVIMASDWLAPAPVPKKEGFSVALATDAEDEAKQRFEALSAGGKVTMPLTKTFWANAFGMLVDQFGVPWMVQANTQPHH